MTRNADSLCWPESFLSFELCNLIRLNSFAAVLILLFIYLFASVLGSLLFLNKKTVKSAYFALLCSTLIQFWIVSMDFGFMGNYHYMLFIITFFYLFIPFKKYFIPIQICLFYFFSGLLKISNMEWLTGMAVFKPAPSFVSENSLMVLCFLVVLLEMIGCWFLVLKTKLKKAFFFCFMIFHTVSYIFVGWFYPVIMFCLLSLFPLQWIYRETAGSFSFSKKILPGLLCLGLYMAGQIHPYLIKGDQSLTGEGRLVALHMFDAYTKCSSQTVVKFKDKTVESNFSSRWLAVRVHCDPYIYFHKAEKICRFYKEDKNFIDLDLILISKLESDFIYKKLIDEKNFCSKNISYSQWRKNKWIKAH